MKSYLLLRDNKQIGPFTIEQLQEQGLQNSDLVYIEGRSFSWRYPSEIEELKDLARSNAEQTGEGRMVYEEGKLRYVENYQSSESMPEAVSFDFESEQAYLRAHSVKVRIKEYQEEINYYATQNLAAEPVRLSSRLKQLFDQRKLVGMIRFW